MSSIDFHRSCHNFPNLTSFFYIFTTKERLNSETLKLINIYSRGTLKVLSSPPKPNFFTHPNKLTQKLLNKYYCISLNPKCPEIPKKGLSLSVKMSPAVFV